MAVAGSTDPDFAARVAVGTSLHLTLSITNNTGTNWAGGATFKLNEVRYQDAAATPNTVVITSDDGTGTLNAGNAAGTSDPNLTGNTAFNELSAGGTMGTTFQSAAKTITYTAPIASGATVQFEATWIPAGGGNRPVLGIADLTMTGNSTAAPEPAMLGLAVAASFGLIRRRSAK